MAFGMGFVQCGDSGDVVQNIQEKGGMMKGYRLLEKGEIIQAGDEVDACRDGWRDNAEWEPAKHCIGEPAPEPRFPSHRKYRRLVAKDGGE